VAPLVSHDLDSTPALLPGAMPAPEVGAPAVVVPMDGGEPIVGELTLWSPGGGIVVTSRIRVGRTGVSDLAGARIWVRMRTPEALVVLRAVGQPVAGHQDELELVGVTGLAVEARRQAVRARIRRPILLMHEGIPAKGTETLDLSATGCRVRLPEHQQLRPGDRLQTVVTDAHGGTIWLRSEVVRVHHDRDEAALRFIEISDADRNRIDRDVLAWHSRPR
jgi:hypothetical protein